MIGNSKWFKRRKYTGWGLTPSSWQGWVYVLGSASLIIIASALTYLIGMSEKYRTIIISILLIAIVLDFVDIARKMRLDEREKLHEAIAERNATWFIILILAGGIIYQSVISVIQNKWCIDPLIIIALLGGSIVKGFSNWYLSDK